VKKKKMLVFQLVHFEPEDFRRKVGIKDEEKKIKMWHKPNRNKKP
jgi:hypothetical protein